MTKVSLFDRDLTYIELRILTFIDCKEKVKKISNIINFFNDNDFLPRLTILYSNELRSENIPEKQNISSLSIDMRDNRLRFKFFDGVDVFWFFHTDDLLAGIKDSVNVYKDLFEKYKPITNLLFNMKKRFDNDIISVSYKYLEDDYEVQYLLTLNKDMKGREYVLLSLINKEIIMLGKNFIDFPFNIKIDFQDKICIPCEEAKKENNYDDSE